jgi:hypothetical protein
MAKSKPKAWSVESMGAGVSRLTFTGRSQWVYLSSDWHWDSTKCDRDALEDDLRTAKELGAAVCSFGDHFDCMGGKYDPRSSKSEVRPEFSVGNYFDEIVNQCCDWMKPYRESMALITPGNHETAIRKRQETCLTTRLVERLRVDGSPVVQNGYAGWLLIRGVLHKSSSVYRVWYHHGFGGGGPVTRGVIDFSRLMVDVDADAIVAGHVHQKTLVEASRHRITPHGIPSVAPVHLVRSSTYKRDSLHDGWAVEKGMAARPVGGWWLRLKWNSDKTGLVATYHDKPRDEGA